MSNPMDNVPMKPCPTNADIVEAFDMTRSLIQEAKPREGYITDHLDAAEGWLDKLEEIFAATRADPQVSALVETLRGAECWLTAALNCETWIWDGDQRECAIADRDTCRAVLQAWEQNKS